MTREVLDRLATPHVRDRIVAAALRDAGLEEVPEDPASFGSFACSSLREQVEAVLGEDAASAVITDLGPVFVQPDGPTTGSGVRRRKRASLAAPSAHAPVVVVASASTRSTDVLTARLKDRAKVIATYDVFALLSAVTSHPKTQDLTLLVDDEMPAMRASTLDTLARLLPQGARVVVWGQGRVRPDARAQSSVRWVWLGPVEEIDAVADVCLSMFPEPSDDEPSAERPAVRTVLVAHDDPNLRTRLVHLLSGRGYEVSSAPDGFMALDRCLDETPHAVVAGMPMAALDGAQLAALLHGRYGDRAPPVVLVADAPPRGAPIGVAAVLGRADLGTHLLRELESLLAPR